MTIFLRYYAKKQHDIGTYIHALHTNMHTYNSVNLYIRGSGDDVVAVGLGRVKVADGVENSVVVGSTVVTVAVGRSVRSVGLMAVGGNGVAVGCGVIFGPRRPRRPLLVTYQPMTGCPTASRTRPSPDPVSSSSSDRISSARTLPQPTSHSTRSPGWRGRAVPRSPGPAASALATSISGRSLAGARCRNSDVGSRNNEAAWRSSWTRSWPVIHWSSASSTSVAVVSGDNDGHRTGLMASLAPLKSVRV